MTGITIAGLEGPCPLFCVIGSVLRLHQAVDQVVTVVAMEVRSKEVAPSILDVDAQGSINEHNILFRYGVDAGDGNNNLLFVAKDP